MSFLPDPSYRHLMDYALRALSRRAHTVHEMRTKLQKRPHHTLEIENGIIDRLIELNLLNDEAYIERAIESAAEFRHQGLYKVAERLYRKGIGFELVQKKWRAMELDEMEIAREALKKLNAKLKTLPKTQHYQKRAQFLGARGFSPAVIFELAQNDEPM